MSAAHKTPEHPASLLVYPAHPERYPDEYIPGVGLDGGALPWDEAQAWLEAGLVIKSPSKSKAAAAAEPPKPEAPEPEAPPASEPPEE